MRRKDREITDPKKIREIISKCKYMRLGFYDQGQVYVVPMNFGYVEEDDGYTFYFHSAREGRKVDLIRQAPDVGFEMDTDVIPREAEVACRCSTAFQSMIGNGRASIVEDEKERIRGLEAVMKHQTGKDGWEFAEPMLKSVLVFKLKATQLSCKEHE